MLQIEPIEFKDASPVEAELESSVTQILAHHRSREQFIPIRRARLIELLVEADDLPVEERPQFTTWCNSLMAVVHSEHHAELESIKCDYDAFNPDVATLGEAERSAEQKAIAAARLFSNFVTLATRANYRRLSREQIEAAADAASDWGIRLHIDFAVFEHLEVYVRGDVITKRRRRRWQNGYRLEEVEVPVYERLAVLFQLREHKRVDRTVDTQAIYLKLFKNIPQQDVDMLLPCGNFRMSWIDHGKVIVPTMSGFVVAVVKGFTAAFSALFTGLAGFLAFLVFVVGTAGYGVKSFLGYLRTKDKYQLNLTRNLYYQNLDNNAGVLFRIVDEAEEQESREVILAYALLRRRAGKAGWTEHELDSAAEEFLEGVLGFAIDFEVSDALQKLEKLGCASVDESGRWRALPLSQATAELNRIHGLALAK